MKTKGLDSVGIRGFYKSICRIKDTRREKKADE